jgi:hypothetical protein
MTQEEKQLLLTDLCARLPYGIIVHTWYNECIDIKCIGIDLYTNAINLDIPNDDDAKVYIDNVKPYLRPMSSMTEEEYYEFRKISGLRKDGEYFSNHLPEWGNSIITERVMVRTIDWLNSHYFDYRGLIPMGLALEAPEDMYKTE